jgi:hypothetical protein
VKGDGDEDIRVVAENVCQNDNAVYCDKDSHSELIQDAKLVVVVAET